MLGEPDLGDAGTALVERFNLTIRAHNARYVRRGMTYSKSVEQHVNMFCLSILHYNWLAVHSALKTTPSVAAGLIRHQWSIHWIAELAEMYHETARDVARRADETPKSYAAFLAYVALGARRSVREAAHQNHIKTISTWKISSVEDTTVRTWLGWSSRHKWVSRANARDALLVRVSDEQIVVNLKACHLALTTRAHGFLTANDGGDFLRAARALSLHFPPMQRVADVSERIEALQVRTVWSKSGGHARLDSRHERFSVAQE